MLNDKLPAMNHESYLAVCPYYQKENSLAVRCMTWTQDATVLISFRTAQAAKEHKERHCRSLTGCTDCPIHQMVLYEIAGKEESPQ